MAIILGLDETCNGYVLAMEEDSSLSRSVEDLEVTAAPPSTRTR